MAFRHAFFFLEHEPKEAAPKIVIGVAAWDPLERWHRVEWTRGWEEREKQVPLFAHARLVKDKVLFWLQEGLPGYDVGEMRRMLERTPGWLPPLVPRDPCTDAWWAFARVSLIHRVRLGDPLLCDLVGLSAIDEKIEALLRGA